jgi:hypothetical protein
MPGRSLTWPNGDRDFEQLVGKRQVTEPFCTISQYLRPGEIDPMKHAAAEERIRKLALAVARDDDDRADCCGESHAERRNVERHLIDLVQQVVREITWRFVDLVDR